MKEISSQLYGLEAELGSTSETNGTTCFCVDTGTVFVAYGGIWYEQRNVYWKVGGAAESDLSGYSRYMPSAAAVNDLVCFNAMDTGDRYVAYLGHWFKQPVSWSDTALLDAAAAQSPAELPAVTSDDNGDVLTVVSGAWAKAAQPPAELPAVTSDDNGDVLTVVSGAWAKAAPSGGGSSPLIEEFTWSGSGYDMGYYSTDDVDDILAAYDSGRTVIFHFTPDENEQNSFPEAYITLVGYLYDESDNPCLFLSTGAMSLISDPTTHYLVQYQPKNGKFFIHPYWD